MTPHEQEIADRQRRALVELANAYREIMHSVAWVDLMAFMDRLVADSNQEVDKVDIDRLTVAEVGRARGMREAVDKIRKHVGYRTSDVGKM